MVEPGISVADWGESNGGVELAEAEAVGECDVNDDG
jgi:hypothetical protein